MKLEINFSDKKIWIILVVLLIFGAMAGKLVMGHKSPKKTTGKISESRPNMVLVQKTRPEKIDVSVNLSGHIESKDVIQLVPQTDGIVKEIRVQQGTLVKAGDIILVLDEKDKQAEFRRAKQLVSQRRTELNTSNELFKSGDEASTANNQAKTALEDALSQLERAKNSLDYTNIRSTIDGYLDRLNIKKGDYISPQIRLGSIFNDKDFIVVFSAPQKSIQQISVGKKVIVTLDGKKIEGIVSFISNIANPETKTYYGEINLENFDKDFLMKMIGAPVQAKIIFDEVNGIKLKDSAAYIDDNGKLNVKIVGENSKVASMPVTLFDNDSEGMTWFGSSQFTADKDINVIVRGAGFLNDGDEVKNIEFTK